MAIEQSYINLSDICHFLSATDQHLKALSTGVLATKTVRLILQCDQFASLLNVRIFRRASSFLKELSNDNQYCAQLYSSELSTFVANFSINIENVDFYWCVLEFWLNTAVESRNLSLQSVEVIKVKSDQTK